MEGQILESLPKGGCLVPGGCMCLLCQDFKCHVVTSLGPFLKVCGVVFFPAFLTYN